MHDSMEMIVGELRDLPPSRRRRILAQLSVTERRAVEAMLRSEDDQAAPSPEKRSLLTELSPWLRERVAAKLQPDSPQMTDAGRAALRQALDALSAPAAEMLEPVGQSVPTSLLGRVGHRIGLKRQQA